MTPSRRVSVRARTFCWSAVPTIERDRLAARDVAALLGEAVEDEALLTLDAARLKQMREAFAAHTIRGACPGCEWHDLCTGIAAQAFAGTRIAPC